MPSASTPLRMWILILRIPISAYAFYLGSHHTDGAIVI